MAGFNLQQYQKQRLIRQTGKCSNAHCQHVRTKENWLSIDHVVPKAIFNTYGLPDMYNEADNLIVLCNRCNSEKGAMLDPRLPQTKDILTKLHTRWMNLHFPTKRKEQNVYAFRTLPVKHDTETYHFANSRDVLKDIYQKQTSGHVKITE